MKRNITIGLGSAEGAASSDDIPLYERAQIIEETVESILKKGALCVLAYIAADTLRQVAVEVAKQRA